jgi:hypothetical protein
MKAASTTLVGGQGMIAIASASFLGKMWPQSFRPTRPPSLIFPKVLHTLARTALPNAE